jgi:prepilin-type N-terminal cleavage/methylation domain-containing protein/prepilin-type processing-associated H-X9-DG protein
MKKTASAFTLIELLVVIGIIAVLAAMLLPALSRARSRAQQVACVNNLREMRVALQIYATEHDGFMPPRQSLLNHWPAQLQPGFLAFKTLCCPNDPEAIGDPTAANTNVAPDLAPRSYLMNGCQDALAESLGGTVPPKMVSFPALRESVVIYPSDTILFGEKASTSAQFYLVLDSDANRYLSDLEEGRHGGTGRSDNKKGSSNYAFGDGSVRAIPWGESTCPANQWAITDDGRLRYAICRPH